jgi:hypothetical protein
MYQLVIVGPKGRQTLEWDPYKLQKRDPSTMKTVAEADRLFKEAVAHNRTQVAAGDVTVPRMAVSGRWSA